MSSVEIDVAYEYDELHRLVAVKARGRAPVRYTYDAAGNRLTLEVGGVVSADDPRRALGEADTTEATLPEAASLAATLPASPAPSGAATFATLVDPPSPQCPSCGAGVAADAVFCSKCGARVAP